MEAATWQMLAAWVIKLVDSQTGMLVSKINDLLCKSK
jgi:hypothetical protein